MAEPGTSELPTGICALIGYVVSGKTRTENLLRLIKAATLSVISVLLVVSIIAGSVPAATGHVAGGLALLAGAVTSPVVGGLSWKGFIRLRAALQRRKHFRRRSRP
ncbi:hypothetical protein [Amycolatopsis balhimycina]|uniref:hypothetical protein n=1 Tax=Amycolatopsis balhimycina TaxID=208443 RepID=UPI000382ADF9|nr:hypothetical protein [Amycolatopsis balhimycina]